MCSNLLVAGKTMAQSFLADYEHTSPSDRMVERRCLRHQAAADMARTGRSSAALLEDIKRLQEQIAKVTPIDWTIPEVTTDEGQAMRDGGYTPAR
jgi:prophage DNA circulation protein